MRIIVQKFGGTSVASPEVRELALRKIEKARDQGFNPVVVVSAMGRKGAPYATDTLIDIARSAYKYIADRELDQIMCCGEIISAVIMTGMLQAAGMDAVMLTGGMAGIITDEHFTDARILKCDPTKIINLLKQGKVPVVCGFQGMTGENEFTTLGRGGSDTSASALGAALNADIIEIYTDVDGIMTADPRIVENAKILDCISYGEVCQLAHQGAKVIHPRAVEIAMQKNIPLVVKSTFSEAPGTLITNIAKEDTGGSAVIDRVATGVTYLTNIVQVKVHLDDTMGTDASFEVFKTMADNGISVDLINIHPGEIMFTINADHAEKASIKLKRLNYEFEIVEHCAKVSVVGGGMREVPGVMASFIEALSRNKIAILQTVDSHTSISVLVLQSDIGAAVKSLHEKFGLSN
ncbi:Aspartokinase [Sporomusa ovata DSM 2662]|uniref:Aspartokinase n=1 Tax=Sporomusa ovata TaxID=2378 RepID=A0A0U1KW02_9FIRM|nr:aspartate kinase [Sporomusa ovata]EQB29501.1 aspartokinase 1 [Sporomusa ovata DSM 2662]CQR71551.1 Aspartokinase [Sporomusa ovata]